MDGDWKEWTRAEVVSVWPEADPLADGERLMAAAVATAREARAEALAGALRGTARGVGRLLRSAAAAVHCYLEERRTLAALRALDDRTLKDIGISRGQLMHVASRAAAAPAPGRGIEPCPLAPAE